MTTLTIKINNSSNAMVLLRMLRDLKFVVGRSTNANAESFNSKIKGFRANLRGVTDVNFFLFRLEKLFA